MVVIVVALASGRAHAQYSETFDGWTSDGRATFTAMTGDKTACTPGDFGPDAKRHNCKPCRGDCTIVEKPMKNSTAPDGKTKVGGVKTCKKDAACVLRVAVTVGAKEQKVWTRDYASEPDVVPSVSAVYFRKDGGAVVIAVDENQPTNHVSEEYGYVVALAASTSSTTKATEGSADAPTKKGIENLLHLYLGASTEDSPRAYQALLAAGAITIAPDSQDAVTTPSKTFWNKRHLESAHIEQLTVASAGPRAVWFHGVVKAVYVSDEPDTFLAAPVRLSGIAVDDGGWKIAAIAWSRAIPDAELFKQAHAPGSPPPSVPDVAAAKVVASWLRGGSIAKDVASSPLVIANGTAPNEIAQGAGAAKLAKIWDTLKMTPGPFSFEAKQVGTVAFVKAPVALKGKKPGTAITMWLGAVLVEEYPTWRWVSLSFTPEHDR
jgi:hypothetical protein